MKSYLTSCQCIGGHKKKEKNNKSKTTTLTFLHNLKKKQQYQGSENWCYAESFVTDNLFQNYCILFWKYWAFEINFKYYVFCDSKKKKVIKHTQKHFQIQQKSILIIS